MAKIRTYRCTECGDEIDEPGLCDYHYAFKEGRRIEREKWLPVWETLKECNDGFDLFEIQEGQSPARQEFFAEIHKLISDIKESGEK